MLRELFSQVHVPEEVLAECTARPTLPDALRIRQACDAGQLNVCIAKPISAGNLGPGERSAIGKALEISAALLADDLAARRHAESLGLVVIGTLGLLVRAKRKGLLPQVRPLIERLRVSGHRLSDGAVQAALAAANERDS